jgi:glycosyltransferase involved in cell wall biosynthesis
VELPVEIENFLKAKKHIIHCYIVLRKGFFIETLVDFIRRIKADVGIILTGIRSIEDEEITGVAEQLKELEKRGLILMVEDLDHDEFMTLLSKSDIYLRTPISDGVASSVLEALSLKVPVVASENGKRPEGVLTYKAGDVDDLENKVSYVLGNIDEIKRSIYSPPIRDTVKDEIGLLVGAF